MFGFSHTLLRVLTLAAAVVLLWIVDRILRRAGASTAVRVLAAVLVAGNPVFLHLAFYCTDDSNVISMDVPPGYTVLATLPVWWWLADGPDVILSRR